MCVTEQAKTFWCCPSCQKPNFRKLALWIGPFLLPAVYLTFLFFLGSYESKHSLGSFGRFLNSGWAILFYPIVGIPFLWLGDGGWVKKIGLCLAYWFFCYGLGGVLMFLFFSLR